MSDTHDEAEDHALDTFEPAPDSFDPYAHIPTVVAIGSRFALDPLINELPKQGYRTVVTDDPTRVTHEAGQVDVVIATDEASTPWEGTKEAQRKASMPTPPSHHEKGNQSGKGLRRKPLPSRTVEALDARLCNAEHAGASRAHVGDLDPRALHARVLA